MGRTDNLKMFGSGAWTEEEEKELRRKGAEAMLRRRAQKRNAAELFAAALDSKVKDRDLKALIKQLGMEGDTVDVLLVAASIQNAVRKGLVPDVLEAFNVSGRTESATDEAAHAAFIAALTSGDDRESTEPTDDEEE